VKTCCAFVKRHGQEIGNIRELRNVIERGIILSENGLITPQALPHNLFANCGEPEEDNRLLPLAEIEKRHILRTIEYLDGNRSQAAETLGVTRKTLYRKLKEFGIDNAAFSDPLNK